MIRLALAVGAALAALAPAIATADTPIPAQQDWVAARQSVTTADGQQLTYVEMGPRTGCR